MSGPECRACSNAEGNDRLVAREMMFGLREEFEYVRCGRCGALSLVDIPRDLSPYYPRDYEPHASRPVKRDPRPLAFAKALRTSLVLRLPTRVVERAVDVGVAPGLFRWLAGLGLSRRSAICDVGTGSGATLSALAREGFTKLLGIDPYLADRDLGSFTIRQLSLDELSQGWDLLLFVHSFEHVPDPQATLSAAAARLNAGGTVVIRIPMADSEVAARYGEHWVGLDAPRHIMIPTVEAMRHLAARAGLAVDRVFWDSHALGFWGSEQYAADISLRGERSYGTNPDKSMFDSATIARYGAEAERLNRLGRGDSATFMLTAGAQSTRSRTDMPAASCPSREHQSR